MRVALLAFLTTVVVGAGILSGSSQSKTGRTNSDGDFKEKLKRAYQLLKGERNADDTMKFLEKLHSMAKEIKSKLSPSPKQSAGALKTMKKYADIKKVHINPKGDTIEEINRKSNVDAALFQGDIILTKQQAEAIIQGIKGGKGNRIRRQAFRDKDYPKYLWSKEVNYHFYNTTPAAQRVFKKATVLWSWNTCIDFKETNTATDKINVVKAEGCWSHIGKLGGPQTLSIGAGCETVGTAVHEIGHALGLYHTHSRHDRDRFITLYSEKIRPGWEPQYVRETELTNYNYNLTYDYGSVMHYGATGVSIDGQPFMIPHDEKFLQTLGSPFLSFYDKLMVNLHYNCDKKCPPKSSAKCQNGGFPHPRDCKKCICPSGYGGILCNERPPGCGAILKATDSYQTLNDTIGRLNYDPNGNIDEFYTCYYWLEAPTGSTIEVTLVSFTDNLAVDGCIFAGVEIKTLADQRHTGYRFCSPKYAGTRLVSTYSIVPVITYSRIYPTNTVLIYRIASSAPKTNGPRTGPTRRPSSTCRDDAVCSSLLKQDMCKSENYDDDFKRETCPKLCRIC